MELESHRIDFAEHGVIEGSGALVLGHDVLAIHFYGDAGGDSSIQSLYVPARSVQILNEPDDSLRNLTVRYGLMILIGMAFALKIMMWGDGLKESDASRLPISLLFLLAVSFGTGSVIAWRRVRYTRYKIYSPHLGSLYLSGLVIAINKADQAKLEELIKALPGEAPRVQHGDDLEPIVINHAWRFLHPWNRGIVLGLYSMFVAVPLFFGMLYFWELSVFEALDMPYLIGSILSLAIIPCTIIVTGIILQIERRRRGPTFDAFWAVFRRGEYSKLAVLLREIAEADKLDADVCQMASQLYWDSGDVEKAAKWAELAGRQAQGKRNKFTESFSHLVNWAT